MGHLVRAADGLQGEGSDVGTFTDVLVFNEDTGELTEGKVLSTPGDPSRGIVTGIESVCEKVSKALPTSS